MSRVLKPRPFEGVGSYGFDPERYFIEFLVSRPQIAEIHRLPFFKSHHAMTSGNVARFARIYRRERKDGRFGFAVTTSQPPTNLPDRQAARRLRHRDTAASPIL